MAQSRAFIDGRYVAPSADGFAKATPIDKYTDLKTIWTAFK
ncbi:hypothetical protein GCM10011611_17520 [Aliidongia dinghuensis]|uniref:Uncharacterized protein n=1 Tax=Aliidongia dinghuensis TaxID=1867774 RepID=A0A8J2YSF3_9PROT|nr:hypothetical protein [Aliidongia dinghuensis]GGF12395.1 hypothetical protein GCM10011611_17520 [Aliidongia dinghuensis]